MKKIIHTDKAPKAIGAYSQAVQSGNLLFCSGQIPLVADTMQVVSDVIADQIHQVFNNLQAVIEAAGGNMDSFIKLTVYLTDLSHFALVNQIMEQYFCKPYPARAALEVAGLPRNVLIEIEGIADLS